MTLRIDRVVLAVHDAERAAEGWTLLVGAKKARREAAPLLGADKLILQVGESEVELLTPVAEDGLVAEHLNNKRGGPFAAGVAVPDLDGFRKHLKSIDVGCTDLGDQLFLSAKDTGAPGLKFIVSQWQDRKPVGNLKFLYEVTHLTDDAERDAAIIARLFDVDREGFVRITSEQYGYDGYLTLFDTNKLDRIETIRPTDLTKTMGRFFDRFGPTMYMCYGETDDVSAIRARAKELAPNDWTGDDEEKPDGMFIHPSALGGVMLGISRTTHAWTWSGYPDRRIPA
jgi:hypothetical protein